MDKSYTCEGVLRKQKKTPCIKQNLKFITPLYLEPYQFSPQHLTLIYITLPSTPESFK
jgi:hypothetical protein